MVAIYILTIVFNGMLIVAYCKFRFLRTTFGIYIISLACGDLLQTLILGISNVINFSQSSWPLGKFMCGLVLYSRWAVIGFGQNVHLLICINRLWAVVNPNSYRLYHNRRLTALLVISVAIYVNLWTLPGFIYYLIKHFSGVYSTYGCNLQATADLAIWMKCVVITMFLVPELLIVIIYPIIYYKVNIIQARKKRAVSVIPVSVPLSRSPGKHLRNRISVL